jgi:hypothetical protein
MKGLETAIKSRKAPQADGDPSQPVPDRRHAASRQTKMYQDAQRLLRNATELKEAIATVLESHDPAVQLSNDKIADYLYSDAQGFLWALNMYVGSVCTLVDLRSDMA